MKEYNSIHDFILDESFLNYSFQRKGEDMDKWEAYIKENPTKQKLMQEAKLELLRMYEAVSRIDAEANFEKLRPYIDSDLPAIRRSYSQWYYVAASISLFLFATICLWIFYLQPFDGANTVSYKTKPSEKRNIELPDGTLIKLNADSHLEVADGFGESNRSIKLVGEAYLIVAKNPNLPFTISTSTLDVNVLGTTLNVRAYPNEDRAAASLIEGSAEVILKNRTGAPIRLKPSDKVVALSNPSQTAGLDSTELIEMGTQDYALKSVTHYDAELRLAETSWTEQKLVFVNEPLSSIAKTLERWYNIKIEFANDGIKNRKYTAAFDDREQLQSVLESLRESQPFWYRKTDARTVNISASRPTDQN